MSRTHLFLVAFAAGIASPSPVRAEESPSECEAIVSVADQKLMIVRDGGVVAKFPVSTSRFGIGDGFGTYRTPLGRLKVCEKLGERLPAGAVIKHRQATGEVLPPNARGRDPIVTRILWLDGQEAQNSHARDRKIYIHGTPEEKLIGRPASYGCIRMKSEDVIAVYNELGVGANISIIPEKLPRLAKYVKKPEVLVAKVEPPAPKAEAKIEAKPEPKVEVKLVAAAPAKTAPPKIEAADNKIAANSVNSKATARDEKVGATAPRLAIAKPSAGEAARHTDEEAPTPARHLTAKNAVTNGNSEPPALAEHKTAKLAKASVATAKATPTPASYIGEARLVAVNVDENRLAFLRNHQASLSAGSSAEASVPSGDLSSRLKGSILDSGLSH